MLRLAIHTHDVPVFSSPAFSVASHLTGEILSTACTSAWRGRVARYNHRRHSRDIRSPVRVSSKGLRVLGRGCVLRVRVSVRR